VTHVDRKGEELQALDDWPVEIAGRDGQGTDDCLPLMLALGVTKFLPAQLSSVFEDE
jgi:hypothetical protein